MSLGVEPLEVRRMLAVTVASTTPDLAGSAQIAAGMKSLKVAYSQPVLGGATAANYELRADGVDNVFNTADDVLISLTPTYVGSTATLQFLTLPADKYQFTAKDLITDSLGIKLDGDANGVAGGDFDRTFTIIPGVATKFSVAGFPTTATAGNFAPITVTALDAYGNVAMGYTGTVDFTSSDTRAVLPADYTFTAADAGIKVFSASLRSVGSRSITATDTSTSITGKQSSITVTPAAASYYVISAPSSADRNTPFSVTVTVKDAYANVASGYRGTVRLTSSDSAAALPANYTFSAGDSGAHTFSVTLKSSGSQSITVTDVANATLTETKSGIVISGLDVSYSTSSNTIYVTGNISVTLSQIKDLVPTAPLTLVNATTHVWFLGANLTIRGGAKLSLHGSSIGGDVNELRLMSNNTGSGQFVIVQADWGTIDIDSTAITSWNTATNGPDTEITTTGRAYIRARSKMDVDGVTPLESRMDIKNSDIGYLGYDASEGYGLSWKVNGNAGPNYELFDQIEVYGDILNSRIHHNWFGVFTYGAYGMLIAGNEVDNNVGYGLDPHDDSDYLTIANNHVHHNGYDGIIASKRCDHVTIKDNLSEFNGQNGIILHLLSDYGTIENNISRNNGLTGISINSSSHVVVRDNTVLNNTTGIWVIAGSSFNVITGNEFGFTSGYGINLFIGTTNVAGDGRSSGNYFGGNYVHDIGNFAIRAIDGDDNVFENNVFANLSTKKLSFQAVSNNRFTNNTLPAGAYINATADHGLGSTITIADQPDLGVQVDTPSFVTFTSADGKIYDANKPTANSVVTGSNSDLVLGAVQIGTSKTQVVLRNLAATTGQGQTVQVHVDSWTTSNKQWTAKTGTASQSVTYAVGDLTPNASYSVLQNGASVATATANAAGVLVFTRVAGTTATVTYSLSAAQGSDIALIVVASASTTTAGATQNVTVTARHADGSLAPDYLGTIRLTSSDTSAVLPANYTFTAGDAGQRTFAVTLKTAGSQTVTATDTVTSFIAGVSSTLSVVPAAATTFTLVGFPTPIVAGAFGTFTVTAKDAYGNVATGYRGTAVFTTNASRATLPGNYTFTADDSGVHSFSAALLTTGSKNIAVTDLITSTITGKQSGITVLAGAPVGMKVLGFPSTVVAGSPGTFTVRVFDANNNTVTGYVGTVTFTSDDPLATLPASYTFTTTDAGLATFSATLRSIGKRSITVTDTTAVITGTQTSITVTA